MKTLIIAAAILALSGCLITDEIKVLNKKYCASDNAIERQLIILAIRTQLPLYPDSGLCGIEDAIKNELENG